MADIPEAAVKQYGDLTSLKQVKQIIIIIIWASSLVFTCLFCFLLGSDGDARLDFPLTSPSNTQLYNFIQ